jgi:hypothetical protein
MFSHKDCFAGPESRTTASCLFLKEGEKWENPKDPDEVLGIFVFLPF